MRSLRIAPTSRHGELHIGHALGVLVAALLMLCAACSGSGSGTRHITPQDVAGASASSQRCQPNQQATAFLGAHKFERLGIGSTTLVLRVVEPVGTSFVADDAVVYYGELTCEFEVGIAAPRHLGAFTLSDVADHFLPHTYNRAITLRALYMLSPTPTPSPDQKNDECVTHTPPTLTLDQSDGVTTVITLQDCHWVATGGKSTLPSAAATATHG